MFKTPSLAGLALVAGSAHAEILTVRYDFPEVGNVSFLFGFFGGEHGPVAGHILSTTLVIEAYTTTGDQDAADFFMDFVVPVTGAQSDFIRLTGADLGWSGQGSFQHSFTTDIYNGEIREGRFGAEYWGGGTFVGDAYIEFTVDAVPAPGATALLAGAGLLGVGRRRR